ncbi:MAG: ATP-binding protein [Planctomycetes bacterium]|nr:ATP-binding protein [Planctomycetota bacterium]
MASKIYPRLLKAPRSSFFLLGARGAGKSTWAKAAFPSAHRLDLLDEILYQTLLRDPGQFASELRTLAPGSWVIVDEVQRIPSLLNEVHRFIEDHKLRFIMLGSSARKLKTSGTNLLAGRALTKIMFPFTPEELGDDFDLEEVLRFGSLPIVWQSEAKKETLEAYVRLYLKEEIKAEALVRNLPAFARFLPVAALFHGQVLNVASLARDAGAARTTVSGYFEILEDTLLAFRLNAYEARLRVKERKHPKLYWIDSGIVRAMKRQLHPLSIEERGSLLEGWVAHLLRTYGALREIFDEWYYWAPADSPRIEVDFLLKKNGELLAIEVKSSKTLDSSDFAGLKAIESLKGLKKRILLYGGERQLKTSEGVEVWPMALFQQRLAENKLWR